VTNVTILIPTYIVSTTFFGVLASESRQAIDWFAREVSVIDDVSADGTRNLLDARSDLYTKLIKRSKNRGKGAAGVSGLGSVGRDFVDSRGEWQSLLRRIRQLSRPRWLWKYLTMRFA
jgi:glycosyltransferase involved in cell wall biosynthesis